MFQYQRLVGHANRLPIFSTISFAAIIFLVISIATFLSNLSLHSSAATHAKIFSQDDHHHHLDATITITRQPLTRALHLSLKQEEVKEIRGQDHDHDHPAVNYTVHPRVKESDYARIALLKKISKPKFEILKPNKVTQQFDGRIQQFFSGGNCKLQFFMTWIYRAKSFGRRELIAMESLFKSHPNGCVAILSRTMDSVRGYEILKPFIYRGYRVLAIAPDLGSLFNSTPAESWLDGIKNGKKEPGQIPLAQNLSNLIRLAVLYKYGGVYLDTDFIVLRDFSCLRNSIGAQSVGLSGKWTRLNNAVLIFDKNHPLLFKFLEEFASTYDGNRWGYNGPYLVSRVVEREVAATPGDFNLTVFPPMAFYPIGWTRVADYFRRPNGQRHSKWVEAKLRQLKGITYAVHLWNRQSSGLKIEEGSIAAF